MNNMFESKPNLKELLDKKLNILTKKREQLKKLKEQKESNEKEIQDLKLECEKLDNELEDLDSKRKEIEDLQVKIYDTEEEIKKFNLFKKISSITGGSVAGVLLIVLLVFNAGVLPAIFIPAFIALLGVAIPLPFYKSNFEKETFLKNNTIESTQDLLAENFNEFIRNREKFSKNNQTILEINKLNSDLDKEVEKIGMEIEKFEEISEIVSKGTNSIKQTLSNFYKTVKDSFNSKEKESEEEQPNKATPLTFEEILDFIKSFEDEEVNVENIDLGESSEEKDTDSIQKTKKNSK